MLCCSCPVGSQLQKPRPLTSARWVPKACSASRQARLLLVLMPLPFALTCVVSAFALAVITDAVVAFVLVRFLVAVAVFVLLVVALVAVVAVVAVVSSNQNFTCLNTGQSAHA